MNQQMNMNTATFRRMLAGALSDSEPIERASDHDIKTAAEILIPFSQEEFFSDARKEEKFYIRMATFRRAKIRALVFLYLSIAIGLMLYNAFSNRSTMIRGGNVGDASKTLAMLEADPAYQAALAVRDAAFNSCDTRRGEYERKLNHWRNEGREARATVWLTKIEQVDSARGAAALAFDATANALRAKYESTMHVSNDDYFHNLIAFALPIMVFLCAFFSERTEGALSSFFFVAMIILMLPNAYLIGGAMYHIFPTPEIDVPLIGKTSTFALIMMVVALTGEPAAYYVLSAQVRKHLESWHAVLNGVVTERGERMRLRDEIRETLKAERLALIEIHRQIADGNHALSTMAVDQQARVAIEANKAQADVAAASADAEIDALIPRATTSTQLAKILIEMKKTGALAQLHERGITMTYIAKKNGLNPVTVRAAISNMKRAASGETAGVEELQEAEAENE